MIDQELLTACVVNSWSVVPRMMLIDSMIESGYSEFKALEVFEPPTLSTNLPLTYNVNVGSGIGRGRVGGGNGSTGSTGRGSGICVSGIGGGRGICLGYGNGSYDNNCGFLMIAKQQWLTKNY